MYSGHPVYNGHLTISQGRPLHTGLTEFMLGFSHHQISQVLDKLHRIFPTAGVYILVEIWDRRHAQRILLIVSNVFQDINGNSDLLLALNDADNYESDNELLDEWDQFLQDD